MFKVMQKKRIKKEKRSPEMYDKKIENAIKQGVTNLEVVKKDQKTEDKLSSSTIRLI